MGKMNSARPEAIMLAPYYVQPYDGKDEVTQAKGNNTFAIRVQPYDNKDELTQAKGNNTRAIRRTAI